VCEIPYVDYAASFASTRQQLLRLEAIFRAYDRCLRTLEFAPQLLTPGHRVAPGIVVVDVELEGSVAVLRLWDAPEEESITQRVCVDPTAIPELQPLLRVWQRVRALVDATAPDVLRHPAVALEFAGGLLVGASVRSCFLEKTELRWWPLSQLEAVGRCAQRGSETALRPFLAEQIAELARRIRRGAPGPDTPSPTESGGSRGESTNGVD
jgi:hypothetical protein